VNRSAQASFDQRLRSADAEIAVAILCGKQSDHHVVVGQPIVDALTVTPALDKPGTSEEL
jgi:hypothetical protein